MKTSWMKLALTFCLLAACVAAMVFVATSKPAAEAANDYLASGGTKQDKGDLDGAIADFNRAIKLRPDAWAGSNYSLDVRAGDSVLFRQR
jgi:tetratricopeptide (TPR) repeat protein